MFLAAVGGHQKQQQNYDQITGVKVSGKKLAQKASYADAAGFRFLLLLHRGPAGSCRMGMMRHRRFLRLIHRFRRFRFFAGGALLCLSGGRQWGKLLGIPASLITAVRLGNVAVIHAVTSLSVFAGLRFPRKRKPAEPFLLPAWPAPAAAVYPDEHRG